MILIWEEFVSHHSHPHNRKNAEQTEQQLFLVTLENWGPALKVNCFTRHMHPRGMADSSSSL